MEEREEGLTRGKKGREIKEKDRRRKTREGMMKERE